MKTVITFKLTNVIGGIGTLSYVPYNHYPMIIEDNISFVPDEVNIYQDIEVPEEVKSFSWKYDGKDFYPILDEDEEIDE